MPGLHRCPRGQGGTRTSKVYILGARSALSLAVSSGALGDVGRCGEHPIPRRLPDTLRHLQLAEGLALAPLGIFSSSTPRTCDPPDRLASGSSPPIAGSGRRGGEGDFGPASLQRHSTARTGLRQDPTVPLFGRTNNPPPQLVPPTEGQKAERISVGPLEFFGSHQITASWPGRPGHPRLDEPPAPHCMPAPDEGSRRSRGDARRGGRHARHALGFVRFEPSPL